MRSKWYVRTKKADFLEWAKILGVDPVTARILRNRDIESVEEARKFLEGDMELLHSPWLLRDMDCCVGTLYEAIAEGKKIRIIGDYDVDGITSTYILYRGFEALGADVDYVIPHRILDGYGLNRQLIEEASSSGCELICTCDNGIAAMEQVELAHLLGMKVVVTDHHEVYEEPVEDGEAVKQILPKAEAVVDPKRDDDSYPFSGICGAMVAFKVVTALLQYATAQNEKSKSPYAELPLAEYVDRFASVSQQEILIRHLKPEYQEVVEELIIFACLGTVCDVMELKDENRALVMEGIQRIKTTEHYGLMALCNVGQVAQEKVSCYHLGFILGPMINATGRLDTAERGLELFLAKDYREAVGIATELYELNETRKNLTQQGIDLAIEYVKQHSLEQKKIWLIYLPQVHESIAGIIAGRIREQYNHPVFVFTKGQEGVKGSGRSIDGYHMFHALQEAKELLVKYGGHAKAAGLSLEEENLKKLEAFLNEHAALTETDFIPKLYIDVPMPLSYPTYKLVEELKRLEPNGMGNPSPVFATRDVTLVGAVELGMKHNCLKMHVIVEDQTSRELMLFGNPDEFYEFAKEKYGPESFQVLQKGRGNFPISIAYSVKENTYRGETTMQLRVEDYC